MVSGSILTPRRLAAAVVVATALTATAGCGDDPAGGPGDGGPQIVVTTTILGDVVRNVVGDAADVEVLMPPGADPHELALSAREADSMSQADLVVVNGAGYEAGIADVIDAVAEGDTPVFTATDHVELRPFVPLPADEGDDHEDEDEGGEADEHDAGEGDDPHVWTDPTNMVAVAEALADTLAELGLDGLDAEALSAGADAYVARLEALDDEIETTLAAVPADARTLVTNHEVFGYFAARYGFTVVGTVIPSGTTQAEPSSGDIDRLADVIRDTGVPAIFGETTQATTLADALADDVGGIEVVELYTESLGEPGSDADTYAGMMRTDAELIAEALT
jgi:zinc/manganese transport system substrate-binding protein